MPNVRQVKQRISTATNIAKITKAMEMVSASKMRKAQQQTLAARPFAQALRDSLQKLAHESSGELHPLLAQHEEGVDILLMITTDRGQCGSLNQNIFKSTLEWYKTHPEGSVVIVGKKGITFSGFMGLAVFAQFTSLPDTINTSHIVPITTLIMDNFINKKFKTVSICYMDFINTLSQKVQLQQLLPIKTEAISAEESAISTDASHEYAFEPSPREILAELLPYYIENNVYQAFLESKASEHSARMVSMKNANENAKDLVKELRLVYNKSRQESITKELLDITTAQLSLQG
ncbi:ATP synthase F1 subunit gamma [Candidatus Woesebacteria bacterium]|nr:ATP synthase F1 subunit gamma [Candidatus Woesebacteria bacterium]